MIKRNKNYITLNKIKVYERTHIAKFVCENFNAIKKGAIYNYKEKIKSNTSIK